MVTRLSGGLTPADGADPRTFPAIWNTTAGTIESQGSAITVAEGDIASQGSAIAVLEGDSIATNVVSPVSGDSLVYDGTDWVNGPRSGNAIINGDFGVWQRGTSFTAETGYTADRWTVSNGVGDVTQSTDVPNDIFEYSLFFESSTTAFSSISTRLESADTHSLLGKSPLTFSAYVKVNQAALDNNAEIFFQTPATKDDFSSTLTIAQRATFSSLGVVADTWKRIEYNLDFPLVSGNVQNGLQIRVDPTRASTAGTASLRITGVQLEAGSVATPFRLAGGGSKAAELSLCQRYYQRTISRTITNLHYYVAGQAIGALRFPYMRDTPDISFSGQTNFTVLSSGSSRTSTAMAASFAGPDAMQLGVNTAAATQGDGAWLRTNSSLDYIEMDAEL